MPNQETRPTKGQDDYQIHLNFLPVEISTTPCLIYRRRAFPQEERPVPQATAHKLPEVDASENDWQTYWVVEEATDGFQAFEYQALWNPDLSRRILFGCLKRSAEASLQSRQYQFSANSFIPEVSLIMASHPNEGDEVLVVQPYFLKASHQLGFLVDFHFNLGHGVLFGRRIQQLSLSLDKNFRRNVDYYVDRSSKVRRFLENRWSVFNGLTLPGASEPLTVSKDFVALPAERLRPKVYVFAGAKEARSQFTGLRDFGPLKPLDSPPRLLFAFREQDRQAARRLASSLKGQKQRGQYNFPGFSELFKTTFEIDANPIILPDLSSHSMEAALQRAKTARQTSPRILPVIVLPNGDDNGYLAQKAHFSHAGMPTQVCTLRILEDEESLKWAIANLALQIFCKAGGGLGKFVPRPSDP
jgi:hypothetical protein